VYNILSFARLLSLCGLLLVGFAQPAPAEELRYDSARDWRQWQLPLGAVELTPDGTIKPVAIHKNINAALGGGIRRVGSNPSAAPLVLDGDPATGWSPDPQSPREDWFIEIDLGRAISAYRVNLVFDQAAAPFELFDLLLSTGEHQVDVVDVPIEGTLVYRIVERYKANGRHRVTFELDQPLHTPIQFVRVANLKRVPGARLVEVEVEAFGDNLLTGLLERGGFIDISTAIEMESHTVTLANAFPLIDGDLTTRFVQKNEPRASFDVHGHITVDLGGTYRVDHVRIVGGVVVRHGFRFTEPRGFPFRYYEVLTSDGSLSPDGTRMWTKHFGSWSSSAVHRRGMADHFFPATPARFVRLRWRVWDAACAFGATERDGYSYTTRSCLVTGRTEELQIFGEGYPETAVLKSPLIDLGAGKNLNAVRWRADTPPDTRLEIRTRTGNQVAEQLHYRDKNGKEITEKRWLKTPKSLRGRVDTTLTVGDDWSLWSKIYDTSGQTFQSPTPRRFLEIEARLISEGQAAALDWLAVDFSPPLADRALGEIAPAEARPGEQTEFTYYLRADGTAVDFDRLAIESTAPLRFDRAYIDGEATEVETAPTEAGFDLGFPRRIGSGQLVELRFTSTLFQQSTRFDVLLEDSRRDQIRQRAEAGDANPQIASNSNVVRIPVDERLFGNIEFSTPALTPNGDGRNDALIVEVDLFHILVPRPLTLRIYDLGGRLLHAEQRAVKAGRQTLVWKGRAGGALVPPGLYVVEVQIEGDGGQQRARRALSLAY
jgi:hypothetical protein